MKKLLVLMLTLVMVFTFAACGNDEPAPADEFPSKDITLIVPYAAGGTTDLLARALSTQLSTDLGVNVVVQNVEGGGGTTGTSQAVNSAADGYTLAICSNGGYLINPEVNEVGYKWNTTTPVAIVSEIQIGIAVAGNSEYQTLEDLIAAEGPLTYSTPGANSTPHLLAAAIAQEEGNTWNHSPNSSSPAAIAELIGGHIDFMSVNLPTYAPYTANGDVRVLAVTGEERDPAFPDVPTLKELGYDFPASVYFCIVAPADLDPAVTETLSAAIGTAMENEDVIKNFESLKFPMTYIGAADFAARIGDDFALYEGILKGLGVIE